MLGLVTAGVMGARINRLVLPAQIVSALPDANASLDLYPLLDPTSVTCEKYWESIPTSSKLPAYITLNVNNSNNSTNRAEWRPNFSTGGLYRIEAFIPSAPTSIVCTKLKSGTQNTSQAIYKINHLGGLSEVTVNQHNNPNLWVDLGTYQFAAGDTGFVSLSDLNSETSLTRLVVFSVLRFTPQDKNYSIYLPFTSKYEMPSGQSSVVIRQRQAFDSCNRPSVSQMQTWWNKSPYYIYNIYMGGISNSGCHPETLTKDWISSVHAQGWEFIPTWVGPQAPCTTFTYRFSSNPLNAFGEGVAEANLAYNRALSLGLVGNDSPKSVIYYDMEAFYEDPKGECRLAVENFLSGWSQRLHELDIRSGVYGSSCYYMPDWKSISNPLDDVWLASWYMIDHDNNPNTPKVYFYDPSANVWSVACSSSLSGAWTDHQRIRQYGGGHNETWGGVTVNIDSNIVDGRVFSPSGATALISAQDQQPIESSVLNNQIIDQFQIIAPQSGWIFQNGRLRWTVDGGSTWVDRTPIVDQLDFIAFHFQDKLTGWTLGRVMDGNQTPSLMLLRTTDGGESWLSSTIPLSPELASQSEMGYFNFISSTTGWLTVRFQSSSAFSVGKLFFTRDGGDTWQELNIPIGDPVYFINNQVGWTSGGAGGDEFYITRDGGLSWEPAGFIAGQEATIYYGLPEFSDLNNGILLVTISDDKQVRVEQYSTQDGGISWQLLGLVPIKSSIEPGVQIPVDVIDGENIVAADSQLTWLSPSENYDSMSLLVSEEAPKGIVEIQFISSTEGWLKTVQSSCSGGKTILGTDDFECTFRESIWWTVDSGLTWKQIR